ncbi:hypothetical protein GKZ90_0002945 [Flavobacterium sp. MC2016-06]|uniref:hypothetical protein n=1 Tax=Flavobacterium sp. MC2016-06 TaxID=2676308 RepID=UPI0012BA6DA6|nr:hypothetical protein [Flavobacterium sp. MC2016-06]MBU3860678.1 hypothetical protein [Flavobacterium sp. MC2016-06]
MHNNLFEYFKNKNEFLLIYALLCFTGAVICFILSKYGTLHINGISAWLKPGKFFISVGIFAFTMALYLSYLEDKKQVNNYCWSFIVFFSIELFLITLQAARGRKSHYNIDTPLDRIIFALMGLVLTAVLLHTIYIIKLFFTQKIFNADLEIILSIKLSLIIMILFMLEGFTMISLFKHTVGSEDGSKGIPVLNWSKNYGDLRVAHFFGMHALQVIPLLSFILAKSKKEVYIISTVYFIFVTVTLIQAWNGKSFIK